MSLNGMSLSIKILIHENYAQKRGKIVLFSLFLNKNVNKQLKIQNTQIAFTCLYHIKTLFQIKNVKKGIVETLICVSLGSQVV
jgi:hypothetical protein